MDNLYQKEIRELIAQYFQLIEFQQSVDFSLEDDAHQMALYFCEKRIFKKFKIPHKIKHSLFLFHRAKALMNKEFYIDRLYYELSVIAAEQQETIKQQHITSLQFAQKNQIGAFEYLPDISISTDSYTLFIYNEIFMKERASVELIWEELQLIKQLNCQFDIYLLCFDINYEENPIFEELKIAGLKFLAHYLAWFHFEYQH